MSQEYVVIQDTDTLAFSRADINRNFETVASHFSGGDFPTLNLFIGMQCYRTDQQKIWMLKTISPTVWTLLQDVAKTPLSQEDADGRYHAFHAPARWPLNLQVDPVTKKAGVYFSDDINNNRYFLNYNETLGHISIDRYNATGTYLGPGLRIKADGTMYAEGGTSGAPADGYRVWNAGNDGTGSGLDADLVRGYTPGSVGLSLLAAASLNAAYIALGMSDGAMATTGDVKVKWGAYNGEGWLRCNGLTIGKSGTSATARANDDCWNLFYYLWSYDPWATVSGGRGASALADWNAGKVITLPDLRGRVPVGCDGMGNNTSGRLTNNWVAVGNYNTVGAYGGSADVTLTVAQMPFHNHGGSTTTTGSHNHGGKYLANDGTGIPLLQSSLGGTPVNYNGSFSAAGSHAHSISGQGGSDPHSNMPPFVLVYYYIKL